MRNRWARRVVLGLILAFPLLIGAVASSTPSPGRVFRASSIGTPVIAVEMVLVGGMVFAGRERRRLQMELDAARTIPREVATLSPTMLPRARTPARVSMFGYLRR